jgi:predicted MFS family arabinose efflux permease
VRAALGDMRRHLRRPELLATFAIGGVILFALVGIFSCIGYYLAQPPFQLGTTALGFIFLVYLVGVVATPFGGRTIERIGHRTALVAAILMTAAGTLITLIPSIAAVLVGLALTSTGVFISQAATASYLGHVAGKAKASATGLYGTFYYLGGTCGASICGVVTKHEGWAACVMLTVVVLMAGIALALIFWREPRHKFLQDSI